jgi:hypothetical protein
MNVDCLIKIVKQNLSSRIVDKQIQLTLSRKRKTDKLHEQMKISTFKGR